MNMTSNRVISFDNCTIEYPVGPHVSGSIKGALLHGFFGKSEVPKRDTVTVLRDVNLHIAKGERVGILGPNGAGKSSFLRSVAGLTPIKSGSITVTGNIQSIFDIGLGFEMESSAKENLVYRSALMGKGKNFSKEIEPAVRDFADIGDFFDLPMRFYSSGMFIRVAFAIATWFHGDILLLDEFFSAGDAAFQKKAEIKMNNFIDSAGTLVFVSHDLELLKKICQRGLVINSSSIVYDGGIAEAVKFYKEKIA